MGNEDRFTVNQTGGRPEDDWPDYVFDDDYELMSLEDLGAFIENEGHLPEVPTQEEVTEDGVRVSEFMETSMKKIEELHLYVLQLHEENVRLRQELDRIQIQVGDK